MTSRRAQGVIGTLTYIAAQPDEHASGGLLDPDGTLGKVHKVIPVTNLALTLINGILPFATNALVKMEKYDDLGTQFEMELFRLYFGKILNALVLMYTSANSFVGGAQLALPGLDSMWANAQPTCVYGEVGSSQWLCPEDELGFILFKTIALDFFVAKGVLVTVGEAKKLFVTKWKKQPSSAARADFQTSAMVINLLYVQCLAWLAIPYIPTIVLWQPIAVWLNFKWDFWALKRYMKKPLRTFEARKAQAFIVNFFVISLGIALLNLYFFLANSTCPVATLCPNATLGGPFNVAATNTTATVTPASIITPTEGVGAVVVGMISSPVAAYFVVVVYMTRFSLEKKHRRVTVEYAGTKEQELQEQLSLQAMQIKKKDARIAYFEKNRNRK